ncbi:tRNA 2-thiocytidine biosynthesis protein TtcA [candidate division WOR-3 bacterium]|nr:tRNA 2-thiocytidine biosynthesis protein TtcA [candidate division WOR-3 bacterium]
MWVYKKIFAAIRQYDMLESDGRLAIAFSGGKDSMLLLNFFLDNPIVEDLFIIHIDPGFGADTRAMRDYLESQGVNFLIHKMDVKKEIKRGSNHPCFICSLKRREYLFRIAHKRGYRKIAFGHHKDDIIETFMMNLLFHGEIATSVPVQEFFGGKIEIVRPLYFLWEDWIECFIKNKNLPLFSSSCPYEGKSKRDEIRKFIESYPHAKANLYRALFNINEDYLP